MIIVTGKGHSGTSMIAGLLKANGVFMGEPLNETLDYLGDDGRNGAALNGYCKACRAYGRGVKWDGRRWIFHNEPIPDEHAEAVKKYTLPIIEASVNTNRPVGYKLPESTLMLPWLVQMYPDATFIHISRNYADNTRISHATDNINLYGVDGPHIPLASWVYHQEIVVHMRKPVRWMHIDYDAAVDMPLTTELQIGHHIMSEGGKIEQGKFEIKRRAHR